MSFREEDRQKIGCPSRGFGLAAAAIGVGVGAALYYFFSKRPENPHGEGATDSGWRSEPLDGERNSCNVSLIMEMESDEYTTFSESSTSDDSYDDISNSSISSNRSSNSEYSYIEETGISLGYTNHVTCNELRDMFTAHFSSAGYNTESSSRSESDMSEWDMTSESEDLPEYMHTSSVMDYVLAQLRSRYRRVPGSPYYEGENTEREQLRTFRDRPWTNEECSICFEMITLNQEVMVLPCTHRFHQACILPWLQEKETCPNCRRRAD